MVFDVAVIAVQYRHHQGTVPAEPRLFAEDIFRCFQDGAAGLWEYKLIHFLSGKLFLFPSVHPRYPAKQPNVRYVAGDAGVTYFSPA